MQKQIMPSAYRCECAEDFIGPARDHALWIERLVAKFKANGSDPIKLALIGSPGVGKSQLAEHLLRCVGANKWSSHKWSGARFGVEQLDELTRAVQMTNLFGDYRVIRIEEMDKASALAKAAFLLLMDDLPKNNAVVITSNLGVHQLDATITRRFQIVEVKGPTSDEVTDFLMKRIGLDEWAARSIGVMTMGNVGAALMDAQTAMI